MKSPRFLDESLWAIGTVLFRVGGLLLGAIFVAGLFIGVLNHGPGALLPDNPGHNLPKEWLPILGLSLLLVVSGMPFLKASTWLERRRLLKQSPAEA